LGFNRVEFNGARGGRWNVDGVVNVELPPVALVGCSLSVIL
jgi:hypothetical protein